MLYLNPPFLIINGVSVFGDHSDPLQFYFMPLMPQLTLAKDPETGVDLPQIQLIKYKGEAGNGGFLNFDVNLGISDDALTEIALKIRQDMRLHDKPRLAPVPLEDGTVRLLILGKQTDEPVPTGPDGRPLPIPVAPAADPAQPRFVIKMDHHAKPSLYGNNQSAFSVQLDEAGVVVLEEALKGNMSPIGIVYSLSFLALRPAYSVSLSIDWDRVQKHMDESFSASFMFSSVEIGNVVDELIESRAIEIKADTFVTEDQANSGVIGRRDQAIAEVKDMITDTFFTASIDPVNIAPDDIDKATEVARNISTMAASGGAAGFASFGYRKMESERIDRKNLNVQISERTTVRRNIYPQGHLSGLFNVLRKPGVHIEDFIKAVDLDQPWFRERRINIISRGNFEEDGISSINVMIKYNGEPKNELLETSTDKKFLRWSSAFNAQNALIMGATYTYRVSFKNSDGREKPLFLVSPELVVDTENLEIFPRELYGIMSIPIVAMNFPWEHYPVIEIALKYTDTVNKINIEDSFLLKKESPEETWKVFVLDKELQEFSYKIIYRSADSRDIEMSWLTSTEERVTIRDPFPQKRNLLIVPNVDWTKTQSLFVDVLYEDKTNDIDESESFDFSETSGSAKQFSVELQDKNKQLVQYDTTILFKDGSLTRIPTSFTAEKRVIIRSDMKGHRIVSIQTDQNSFEQKNLREIKVDIRYEDAANGLSYADAFSLKSVEEEKNFEFDYVNTALSSYEYKTSYQYQNGLSRSGEWIREKVAELVIPVK